MSGLAQNDSINFDNLRTLSLKDLLGIGVKGVSKLERVSEKLFVSVIIIAKIKFGKMATEIYKKYK